MQPQIRLLQEKRLVGINLSMSLAQNRTGELWKTFMPRQGAVKNRINSDLISLQIYGPTYFEGFNPQNSFVKWATAEVKDFTEVPDGMETLIVDSGDYAVFHYKGSSADRSIFQYIFGEWLLNSDYFLDNRPHFEVLGKNYRNNDPQSEEEIWIPVKSRV
nr:GyrI-like domain-containing protein [Allomuricauda sp.]